MVKVESDLPDEQLALIGCGVTTGVGAALNTAGVQPGSIVAVIGCGGVGQAVIQGARIAGAARIIAIDPVALKRDAALKLGATDVIDPSDADPIEAVPCAERRARRRLRVRGDRHARAPIRQAVETARPGGTAVMVGVPRLDSEIGIPAMSVLEEKTILGCVYGSAQVRREFPRLISLIEQGKLDVGAMVTRTMHLARGQRGDPRHAGRRGHPQRPRLGRGAPSRVLEPHLDALADQGVVVLRDEVMDATLEQEAHQRVEHVVPLHEVDPGLPIGETLESMLALRPRPQRLPDRVVLGRLVGNDVGDVFPRLRHAPAEEILRHPEEAVAHQAVTVFVAFVQDLDRHGAVLDLPDDPAPLADLAPTTRAVRWALVHDAPDLLGCGIDFERVAMFLHGALPRDSLPGEPI